jgi:hypothetical protein
MGSKKASFSFGKPINFRRGADLRSATHKFSKEKYNSFIMSPSIVGRPNETILSSSEGGSALPLGSAVPNTNP